MRLLGRRAARSFPTVLRVDGLAHTLRAASGAEYTVDVVGAAASVSFSGEQRAHLPRGRNAAQRPRRLCTRLIESKATEGLWELSTPRFLGTRLESICSLRAAARSWRASRRSGDTATRAAASRCLYNPVSRTAHDHPSIGRKYGAVPGLPLTRAVLQTGTMSRPLSVFCNTPTRGHRN